MSKLSDDLDELGFSHKPGSTKGRMYSSRFYHKELEKYIKTLMHELIGEDETIKDTNDTNAKILRNHGIETRNFIRRELRQKVNDL